MLYPVILAWYDYYVLFNNINEENGTTTDPQLTYYNHHVRCFNDNFILAISIIDQEKVAWRLFNVFLG